MSDMMSAQPETPMVYLLADNLDAALAAGEDLLGMSLDLSLPKGASGTVLAERLAERHRFVDRLRSLELTLLQRVLRAREHAADLAANDSRFRAIGLLFVGGTAALLDAVAELGGGQSLEPPLSRDAVAYARKHGMIDAEAAGFDGLLVLRPTEAFLVAERIALGPLLDLLATFLDSLELHFDLFAEPDAPELPKRSLADVIAALR